VIKENNEVISALVIKINEQKRLLQTLVQKGRTHHIVRSEFIHKIEPAIITEQLYRKITIVNQEVKSVWFNWAARNTPKTFTIDQFSQYINRKRKKVPLNYSDAQWNDKMNNLEKKCHNGRFKAIHRFKRRQAFPIIELSFVDKTFKRQQRTATTPYILNGQVNGSPSFSILKSYSREDMVKQETILLPDNKEWIDEDLKLIGVLK